MQINNVSISVAVSVSVSDSDSISVSVSISIPGCCFSIGLFNFLYLYVRSARDNHAMKIRKQNDNNKFSSPGDVLPAPVQRWHVGPASADENHTHRERELLSRHSVRLGPQPRALCHCGPSDHRLGGRIPPPYLACGVYKLCMLICKNTCI